MTLQIDHSRLSSMARAHGVSFYIFYPERFIENISAFQAALAASCPNSQIAYALKANYMPALCAILNEMGICGEVVSGMEYEIARLYLPANKLIFNGPCKSRAELERAIREGAIVNIDSRYEIVSLAQIAQGLDAVDVGLRVSFDIGTGTSRFGFNFENGEFAYALSELGKLENVNLVSLHSHFTTRERSLELFERRIRGMSKVYDSVERRESIKYINIGGGFFGPMSEAAKARLPARPPSFAEYASALGGAMTTYFGSRGPKLVVEPGVSMVADAMDYVVQVLDERAANGRRILTTGGSINCLFPTGGRYTPDYSEHCANPGESRSCQVAGYTCMEHDILLDDATCRAKPGDFFVFHNRGAYSNVYKPPFIREAPAILGLNGVVYAHGQTAGEVIAPYFEKRAL